MVVRAGSTHHRQLLLLLVQIVARIPENWMVPIVRVVVVVPMVMMEEVVVVAVAADSSTSVEMIDWKNSERECLESPYWYDYDSDSDSVVVD